MHPSLNEMVQMQIENEKRYIDKIIQEKIARVKAYLITLNIPEKDIDLLFE